jgi:hypothetical protein
MDWSLLADGAGGLEDDAGDDAGWVIRDRRPESIMVI